MELERIRPLLPSSDWRVERYDRSADQLLLVRPGGGFVTIDFKRRIFATGAGTPWPRRNQPTYAGRDWVKALVDAAVAELDGMMA